MPAKGSVIAFNVPVFLPKILLLKVIKSPATKNRFSRDPRVAVEDYIILSLRKGRPNIE